MAIVVQILSQAPPKSFLDRQLEFFDYEITHITQTLIVEYNWAPLRDNWANRPCKVGFSLAIYTPENYNLADIYVDDCQIQGITVKVIKRLV